MIPCPELLFTFYFFFFIFCTFFLNSNCESIIHKCSWKITNDSLPGTFVHFLLLFFYFLHFFSELKLWINNSQMLLKNHQWFLARNFCSLSTSSVNLWIIHKCSWKLTNDSLPRTFVHFLLLFFTFLHFFFSELELWINNSEMLLKNHQWFLARNFCSLSTFFVTFLHFFFLRTQNVNQ